MNCDCRWKRTRDLIPREPQRQEVNKMAEDLVYVDLNSLNKPELLKIAQLLQNAVKEKKRKIPRIKNLSNV